MASREESRGPLGAGSEQPQEHQVRIILICNLESDFEPEDRAVFQTAFDAACLKLGIDPEPMIPDDDEQIRDRTRHRYFYRAG